MTSTSDVGDGNSNRRGIWRLVSETAMNDHRQLVLDSLWYAQPEQVVVKQL